MLLSCCGEVGEASDSRSGDGPGSAKPQSGFIVGRVLGQDGKPIAVAEDILLHVYGVSEAGERVNFSPAVKADGTYRQRLVPGSYRTGRSLVKVRAGEELFSFELTPQGNLWNKDREAEDGIVQDFVWNMTGQRTSGRPDPNNHTHWHGMSIGISFGMWREDLKKAVPPPPDGSRLVFTLKPTSPLVNGGEAKVLTIERTWNSSLTTPVDDLNDLPPASYEITGIAHLPDGTTQPLLLKGPGDYPNFKPLTSAPLAVDKLIGGMAKWEIDFVLAD